jgi:hypothetical protein
MNLKGRVEQILREHVAYSARFRGGPGGEDASGPLQYSRGLCEDNADLTTGA